MLAPTGQVTTDGNVITVTGADEAVILVAAHTNYITDFDKGYQGIEPGPEVAARLAAASANSYDVLRTGHIADHQALFRRLEIDPGGTDAPAAVLPTADRIRAIGDGKTIRRSPRFIINLGAIS